MFVRILIATLAGSALSAGAVAQDNAPPEEFYAKTPAEFLPFVKACKPWDDWDKPAPPFKVHGNTYYVGTCGIAAILITGEDGHVLIDTGTRKGAEVVAANIQSLGFRLEDVAVILHSHEHFDHVGGFAWMGEQTGAQIFASPEAAPVLESGVVSADDPQSGTHDPMEPAIVSEILTDDFVTYTPARNLTRIATPGHSPGALSWRWKSCENGGESDDCKTIVYADSLSPVSRDGYKFSDHPDYMLAYQAGLERLAYTECDVLLTPHPSHSRMLKRMRYGNMAQTLCAANYAIGKAQDIEKRLTKEGIPPDEQ